MTRPFARREGDEVKPDRNAPKGRTVRRQLGAGPAQSFASARLLGVIRRAAETAPENSAARVGDDRLGVALPAVDSEIEALI